MFLISLLIMITLSDQVVQGCYEAVDVSVESWGTWPGPRGWVGQYHKRHGTVNNKPVYEDKSGIWCIFYKDHWKVDSCDFLTPLRGSVGYLYTDIDKPCPEEVGPQWKFYPYTNVKTPARGGIIEHGCHELLQVSVKSWGTWPGPRGWVGKYERRSETHQNRPVYKHRNGDWCLFYRDHWKVDACDFLTPPTRGSVGYLYSTRDNHCPEDVGRRWNFYPYRNVKTPARAGRVTY